MAFVIGWLLVLLLLALWSGLVWAGHALLVGTLAHAGAVDASGWSLPEGLSAWLPQWVADWLNGGLETWAPQLQGLVNSLPALSGGVTVLAWLTWIAGALLLLVAGLAVHVAIALWRKSRQSTPPPPPRLALR